MAKVTVKASDPTYVLELNEKEARVIRALLGNLLGNSNEFEFRRVADGIWKELDPPLFGNATPADGMLECIRCTPEMDDYLTVEIDREED